MNVVGGWKGLALGTLTVALAGCSSEEAQYGEETPAVEVVAATTGEAAVASQQPGRVSPVRVAEVRARVAGIVLRRQFEEGSLVTEGQVLFQIDPAPFKAAVARAQAESAKAEAELADASEVARRYGPLVQAKAISQQDYDAAVTRQKSAHASLRAAQAQLQTAQLDLGYATVRAPIGGRIGRALVTEGALVGQGETTPLAVVQQLDPVYVDFSQPVGDVLRMRAEFQNGAATRTAQPMVSVSIAETGDTRTGKLLFSDITVDKGTGQVALRGEIANADGLLLPGMYVRVETQFGKAAGAVFVPQRAIVRGTDGKATVMVLNQKREVELREVTTGAMQGANYQILQGLKGGELVVASGAAKVQPGMQIPEPVGPNAATPEQGGAEQPAREPAASP
ncbi:efflux RND transporter periplasmic adaptor subunit [Isoptericola jiangsuensis]|uniref:efflux RND transporter periplasmic adaptor subunit n=1 Tax=Isoptericola jiangsuensis TaxID=548579 RepID=UPI003866E757